MPNAVSEKRPTSRDVIELDASWMRHALVDWLDANLTGGAGSNMAAEGAIDDHDKSSQ